MAAQSKSQHLIESPDVQHHELKSTWTFHYLIPSREGNKEIPWEQFLKTLHSFHSLEDFFAIYSSIEPPDKIPQGIRYYVFKEGIPPLWEDEKNLGGWQITFEFTVPPRRDKKPDQKFLRVIAQKWQDLIIHLLIEDQPYHKHVNGIEFNNRGAKPLKISLWYNKDSKEEEIDQFIEVLKKDIGEVNYQFNTIKEKIITEEEKHRQERERAEQKKEEKKEEKKEKQ